MFTRLILLIALTAITLIAASSSSHAFSHYTYKPEYRHGANYTAIFNAGITHLIFFSIEVNADGTLRALDRLPSKTEIATARAEANKHGAKLLLGFGGNSRSQNMGDMMLDDAARKKFILITDKLVRDLELDGWDWNFEYPRNDAEWRAWRLCMQEMKATILEGTNIQTFTIFNDPNHYQLVAKYGMLDNGVADACLVMIYDYQGRHSTPEHFLQAILHTKEWKLPKSKIVLSLPYYSRETRSGHPETYRDIVKHIYKTFGKKAFSANPEDVGKFDEVSTPSGRHYFNSRATLAWKTRKARKEGFAGVMSWEIEQDLKRQDAKRALSSAVQSQLSENPVEEKKEDL